MIIGTAGHIDHGKSTIVRALTGVDTDRLEEEKKRGITIELGFAYCVKDGEEIGFVDVPGHEKLVHTMLAGAHGVDVLLLVIAADDGVMPQTREHLAIAGLLGIRRLVVALSKLDRATPEQRARATGEIVTLLAGNGFADAPVCPVSALTGEGMEELLATLLEAGRQGRALNREALFRMPVDRSFTLQGTGTVVTGTILSGEVAPGDILTVSPTGLKARVRSVRVQNRPAERGVAGDRCALNLAGDRISKEAIQRGDMIVDPALHAPTARIDCRLRVLASESRPVGQWMPVRFHHATCNVGARVVLLSDAPIAPGEEAFVQLVLERPISAASRDHFVLRDTSAQRTLAGGILLDLRAPARRRRSPERLAILEAHAIADPGAALAALLDRPPFFLDGGVFARDRALTPARFEALAASHQLMRVQTANAQIVLSPANWLRFKRALLETLETFHARNPHLAGIGMERLRLQLQPRLPAPAFAAALAALARAGLVALDGAWIKLAGHEVRMTPEDEALWQRAEPLLGGTARFRPPRIRDISGMIGEDEAEVRRVLRMLSRMGRLDEIAQDHFFLRDTVAEIVAIACELAERGENGQFTVALLRDQLDCGRKVAIFILEFLDRHGVTIRRGDLRRINPHRLDLFAPRRKDDILKTIADSGGEASPVGRPDFKSGRGREPVSGGFDSHSLPPHP